MTKAEIQLIRSLEDKRAREETGLFVAEGEKLVGELLASNFRVRKVFFTGDNFSEKYFPATPSERSSGAYFGRASGVETERVAAKDMERASRLKTPTDCLALVEVPRRGFVSGGFESVGGAGRLESVRGAAGIGVGLESAGGRFDGAGGGFDAAELKGRLTLALDGVQNPGNVGTIIRLADWFGIETILCSDDSADCFAPKVVQATMGAIARVAVHYGDLGAMIGTATRTVVSEARDIPVFGTFLEGENIYETTLSPGGIVVLGSESRGISREIEKLVTRKLFIPPYPACGAETGSKAGTNRAEAGENRSVTNAATGYKTGSESLNVAVAAAIVCSEFRRRI
ncbi:MAG: RNA methyltransferase [Alistipes sp.]|jgi:TrmH family RNA methyltransferase|nr:RNA methyltransferase [Alistipes sp.]